MDLMEDMLDFTDDSLHDDTTVYVDHTEVIESAYRASDFFNIDAPCDIHEDWTTGVYLEGNDTATDDIIIYNSDQLEQMNLTDGDSLDLVMTHEAAHRALNNAGINLPSHQEELCCDYFMGIRAGLNDMDTDRIEDSLADVEGNDIYPDGDERATAVELGEQFAREYYHTHGHAPTLEECLRNFAQDIHGISNETAIIGEENISDNLIDESSDIKGFTDDRAYHLRKAETAEEWAEWHHKKANEAIEKGDLAAARDHDSRAAGYEKSYKEHIAASKKCTK